MSNRLSTCVRLNVILTLLRQQTNHVGSTPFSGNPMSSFQKIHQARRQCLSVLLIHKLNALQLKQTS